MPKKKESIYLETSVISAYFDFWGKSPEQKKITRNFWKKVLPKYRLTVSNVTIAELKAAKKNWRNQYLKFINGIKTIYLADFSEKLAEKYIIEKIIPRSKAGDAAHLALAVTRKIDFFVTWNMRHFLRPHKLKQITDFNKKNKLHLPILIKPIDFLE